MLLVLSRIGDPTDNRSQICLAMLEADFRPVFDSPVSDAGHLLLLTTVNKNTQEEPVYFC